MITFSISVTFSLSLSLEAQSVGHFFTPAFPGLKKKKKKEFISGLREGNHRLVFVVAALGWAGPAVKSGVALPSPAAVVLNCISCS